MMHLALMRSVGVNPDFVIGHSFGELTALHAAGVLSAKDLLRAARCRGELMALMEQVPGAMTGVSYPADPLQSLLREWNCSVVVANYNSPAQTVLSGAEDAIEDAEKRLQKAGISYRRLPVSAAFHSPLISGCVEPFHEFLEMLEFSSPRLEVLSNSDTTPYPQDPSSIRRKLAAQLAAPVRFQNQVEELYQRGVRIYLELGMGSAMSSLIGQTLESREHLAVPIERKGTHGITSMWEALGKLAVAGVRIDFHTLHTSLASIAEEEEENVNPSSTFWIDGSAYGKPYPPRGGAKALPVPNPESIPQLSSQPVSIPAATGTMVRRQPAAVSPGETMTYHSASPTAPLGQPDPIAHRSVAEPHGTASR
jgi:acyl transferase domain-containing protein